MKYKDNLRNITLLFVLGTLFLGCGSSTTVLDDKKTDKEKMLEVKVETYLASKTLPSLHILPTLEDEDGEKDDSKATYTLTANENVDVSVETPNGSWKTSMWRYNNNPLPLIIRTNRGDKMTLKFHNKLGSDSTVHWHGFKIPADMDGGPDIPVQANQSKTYSFTMNQPASSLWFHPHPDMQTGKQVYMGLAGVYIVEDDISRTLELNKELPSGDKDVVLLVQDRRFDDEKNGVRELLYKTNVMDADGMKGSTVLVNGSVMPKFDVETTQYRFRLYNVSNAKTYDFAFSDGRKFKIVGTDGGLLNEPVEVDHIMLGAAERVELIVDFSEEKLGDSVLLVSRPYQTDSMSMDMDENSEIDMEANGMGLTLMRFDIATEATDDVTLYRKLPANAEIATRLDPKTASNIGATRKFIMTMYMGGMGEGMNGASGMNNDMTFVINGKLFDPNRVDEFVTAGTTEIWEIENRSTMAHPFHAHAIQWQILDRNGVPASGTDLGWKDTFLVQEGETVRIIGKFEAVNIGDYMYHCHILEHEDAGMMGYFRVGDSGNVTIK